MIPDTTVEKTPLLSNRAYDVLKYIAVVFLPATGALYFGLSGIWGLPYGEQIVGTVTVVDTFLGALLYLSKRSYDNSDARYDGALVVQSKDENTDLYKLEAKGRLEDLKDKKEITFKVENPQ